jgi:CHASE2 domain-containing sensor protein
MERIPFNKADLLAGIIVAGIFIFFSFGSFRVLESLEKIIYGIEMRLDLPQNLGENRIAIVNIDDKSLEQLGPWPWPRRTIAEMITILKNNGAKLIGLDIIFREREQNQGLQEIRTLYEAIQNRENPLRKDAWILRKLRKSWIMTKYFLKRSKRVAI